MLKYYLQLHLIINVIRYKNLLEDCNLLIAWGSQLNLLILEQLINNSNDLFAMIKVNIWVVLLDYMKMPFIIHVNARNYYLDYYVIIFIKICFND